MSQQSPASDYLHLHSIKATHVHLEESILPIERWDTEIMDAARDVAKWFIILAEAIVLKINAEGTDC